jgi:undecaprenyl-diphosphatase
LAAKLLGLAQTDFQKSFEIVIPLGVIGGGCSLLAELPATRNPGQGGRGFRADGGHRTCPLSFGQDLGNELVVLLALGLGGLVLIAFELFHMEPAGAVENVKSITYPQAIRISLFQALAIVPGVSRSGATIVGGLAMDCPPFTCSNLRPNRKNGWKANQCTSATVIAMNTAAKITSLGK